MVNDDIGHDLFLDPDASFAAAQSTGRDTDDPLVVQPKTLHRRLQQANLLLSLDEARQRLTVRRSLGGARRYVLHLSASVLEGAAQPAQPDQSDHAYAGGGPFRTALLGGAPLETPQARALDGTFIEPDGRGASGPAQATAPVLDVLEIRGG